MATVQVLAQNRDGVTQRRVIRRQGSRLLEKSHLKTYRDLDALPRRARIPVADLIATAQDLGFDGYILYIEEPQSLKKRRQLFLSSNTDWSQQYWLHGYHCLDPVIRRSRQQPGMFQWDQESAIVSSDIVKKAHQFGYGSGITYSRHQGRLGVSSFSATTQATQIPAHLKLQSKKALVLQRQFDRTMNTLHALWGSDCPNLILSDKEYQALYWSAHGKTSTQTARAMNLSEVTVRLYLSSAKVKLRAKNKTESVAKAISLGLIQI